MVDVVVDRSTIWLNLAAVDVFRIHVSRIPQSASSTSLVRVSAAAFRLWRQVSEALLRAVPVWLSGRLNITAEDATANVDRLISRDETRSKHSETHAVGLACVWEHD